jgi:hypothetical protein
MLMDINQTKFNSQIEITDLIGEAVKNASGRRDQALDAQKLLSDLSEEEVKGVMGGLQPTTCGLVECKE